MTIQSVYAFLNLKFEHDEILMPIKKQSNDINERWYFYYNCLPENLIKQYSELRVRIRKLIQLKLKGYN